MGVKHLWLGDRCSCQERPTDICSITLKPNENSGKGRGDVREMDVQERTKMRLGYRLMRGFAILSGNKHDL